MEAKLVSVLTPAYNSGKFINRLLDSVLRQTYPNIEMYVIDDGSKDTSSTICDRYAEKYQQIKVYHKEKYVASVSKSKESGKYKVKKVIENQEDKEDLYSTKDLNYMSYSIGILALEDMDPRLRAVIAAEILKKEK